MMLRVYPDVNALHCIRNRCSEGELLSSASRKQFKLKLSSHVVYELARGCRGPAGSHCRATLEHITQLRQCVELLPDVRILIKAEFHLARFGVPIITVVDPLTEAATWEFIEKLIRGSFDEVSLLIQKRDEQISVELAKYSDHNLEHFRSTEPKGRKSLKTFRKFEEQFRPRLGPGMVRYLMETYGAGMGSDVARILTQRHRFPIINTFVSTQIYVNFIQVIHRSNPAKDKPDDFRHLIESASCDQFVTGDADLVARSAELCPFRPAVDLDAFLKFVAANESYKTM